MVDDSVGLLGKRVGLHTAVDEVDSLGRADECAEAGVLEQLLLRLLESLVGLDSPLERPAELVRYVRRMGRKTLELPVHGRAPGETSLVRVSLVVYKKLRKNANGLETNSQKLGRWLRCLICPPYAQAARWSGHREK